MLRAIELPRVKGGKPFDIDSEWFTRHAGGDRSAAGRARSRRPRRRRLRSGARAGRLPTGVTGPSERHGRAASLERRHARRRQAMTLHARVGEVTERIIAQKPRPPLRLSRAHRRARTSRARIAAKLSCGNLAHGFAACGAGDKAHLAGDVVPNLAIVTAYNDMLSAHQPYERFPDLIREAARRGRRRGAGGGRRAGDVRRRHAGPARHGAVALLARRDRACRPASRCRTTCSTRRSFSASATRSCRAC